MIGTIQVARKSKSGQTLSVQIEGAWYTSKNWELEQSVNRRVIFEPSRQDFPDGGHLMWLNDYVFEDASTTPAGQAMNQAMQAPSPPPIGELREAQHIPPAQPPIVDLSGSIVAQALTKACTGPHDPVTDVWTRYTTFYQSYMSWKP